MHELVQLGRFGASLNNGGANASYVAARKDRAYNSNLYVHAMRLGKGKFYPETERYV